MDIDLIELLGDDLTQAKTHLPASPARVSPSDGTATPDHPRCLSGTHIHESELADLLGITANRIRTLARDGVIKRSGPARYELRSTIRDYTAHLREHASRAGRPSESNTDLKAERLRLTRAQAEAQETKNRQLSGELVGADAVSREWQSILRDVRAAVLAVPSRFGAAMPHLSASDIAALDAEIRAVLEGLADGNA